MSEYFFGLHSGHLTASADRIAKRHDAWHTNYTERHGPGQTQKRGWFACENRGAPFDRATADAVMADIEMLKKKARGTA